MLQFVTDNCSVNIRWPSQQWQEQESTLKTKTVAVDINSKTAAGLSSKALVTNINLTFTSELYQTGWAEERQILFNSLLHATAHIQVVLPRQINDTVSNAKPAYFDKQAFWRMSYKFSSGYADIRRAIRSSWRVDREAPMDFSYNAVH